MVYLHFYRSHVLRSFAQWSRASLLSFSKSKGPRSGHDQNLGGSQKLLVTAVS